MTARIMHGDCAEQMRKIATASVHLCVTSPPYDNLRTYGGYSAFDLSATVRELLRVLVAGGVVCWVVGSGVEGGQETLTPFKQAIRFVELGGFRLHDTMIYHKRNFSHPERTRYHQVFEYVFVFSKGKAGTFNPICDKWNATAGQVGNLGVNTFTLADGSKSERTKKRTAALGMRTNVWTGLTRGQEEMCQVLPHPAMMPRWLARDLIISFSNPGDAVLDPFAGSGTTGQEALKLERRAILIDSDPANVRLIKKGLDGIITPDKIGME